MPTWSHLCKKRFIAGPEFGPLARHTLVIEKALYGLRSSGIRFHERLSSVLRKYNFHRSRVDPDLWMRDGGSVWKYLVVYVDDIIVAMKNAQEFFDELQGPYVGFKMKGIGKPNYHLGADFYRDEDGTLCYSSQTYAKRLCASFESLFGEQPKMYFAPLNPDDHPELDDTPLCRPDDTAKFQSLIGVCQWMISLCRLDIAHAIMSLSRFRHCPRVGHIKCLKHVCGYSHKAESESELVSRIMKPYLEMNRSNMIGWRLYTATLLRKSRMELPKQKGTPFVPLHIATQIYSMIW